MRRIFLISQGGRDSYFVIFQRISSENVLGALYWKLPTRRNEKIFGGGLKNLAVIRYEFQ